MKILSIALLLIFPGVVVVAQTTVAPAAPVIMSPSVSTRIITESGNQVVKGQPFSAEAVSESVQTLADGNRIVRQWSEKLYRSGDGKFRRERSNGTGGSALGSYIVGDSSITITNPVSGFRYSFDLNSKTVHASTFRLATPAVINGEGKSFIISQNGTIVTDKPTAVAAEKAVVELRAAAAQGGGQDITPSAVRVAELKAREGELQAVAAAKLATTAMPGLPPMPAVPDHQKWESHTEKLGTQNFEGVDAEGTRTVTTIPADAIGNERPIEIVYERWYSKELQMIVYSKHSDPRFGEQTYRLTNINRSEPDPSLFEPPPGFKVVSEARPGAYRILSSPKTVPVKAVSTTTVTKP